MLITDAGGTQGAFDMRDVKIARYRRIRVVGGGVSCRATCADHTSATQAHALVHTYGQQSKAEKVNGEG